MVLHAFTDFKTFKSIYRSETAFDGHRSPISPLKRQSTSCESPSTCSSASNTSDIAAIIAKAEYDYEKEVDRIMQEELRLRQQNDRICKREMAAIESRMVEERQRLTDVVSYRTQEAIAKYRAGDINARELEKVKQTYNVKAEVQWTSYKRWCHRAQERTQAMFFAKGEEIGSETGAAIRRARASREQLKRLSTY